MEVIMCRNTRLWHAYPAKKMPRTGVAVSEFKASRGWFDKFKSQTGINSMVRYGEAAS